MQSTCFRPRRVTAFAIKNTPSVSLEMCEDGDITKEFCIHFEDAEALVTFGKRVLDEGNRLLNERDENIPEPVEVPAGCGEAAP